MNKFYLWCDDTTNVENAAAFESDSEREYGFQAGSPARAIKVNSALRQANLIACALTSMLIPDDNTLDLQSSRADLTAAMSTALTNIIKAVKVNNSTHADSADSVLSSFLLNAIYPIGSIYISVSSSASPASSFGGTWELLPSGYSLWTYQGNIDYESAGNDEYDEYLAKWERYRMLLPGLPEISGTFAGGDTNVATGAFTDLGSNGSPVGSGSGRFRNKQFNASKSNSIYGNSTTVQPPAYRVYAWKRIS